MMSVLKWLFGVEPYRWDSLVMKHNIPKNYEHIYGDDLANAKRIVACVNACAGITNEALEAGIVLDSVKLHEAILDQQPSSFFKEYGLKVWEDV